MIQNRAVGRSGRPESSQDSSSRETPLPQEIQAALDDMADMIRGGDAEKIVEHTSEIANLIRNVSTHQIRNVFGPVKRMQLEWTRDTPEDKARALYRQLVLLSPKLDYMVARADKKELKEQLPYFQKVIDAAIDEVGKGETYGKRWEYFENFVAFFEALVAYHRKFER